MSLWTPESVEIDPATIGSFKPIEVVFDFDGPRTFSCKAADGGLLLAHQCDEEDGASRFIVVPATKKLVESLKNGTIRIRAAISQQRMWLVDCGADWEPLRAFSVEMDDLPEDCLPSQRAALKPTDRRGVPTVRVVGPQIAEKTTDGVVATVDRELH